MLPHLSRERVQMLPIIEDPRPEEHEACLRILKLIEEGSDPNSQECRDIRDQFTEVFGGQWRKPSPKDTNNLIEYLNGKGYDGSAFQDIIRDLKMSRIIAITTVKNLIEKEQAVKFIEKKLVRVRLTAFQGCLPL